MSTFRRILVATLVIGFLQRRQRHERLGPSSRRIPRQRPRLTTRRGAPTTKLGEYSAASRNSRKPTTSSPDATFLFNIAQCHRQLREYAEAIQLYRNYLRDAPDAPNREDVEKFIREITLVIEQEKESKPAVAPTPPPVATVAPISWVDAERTRAWQAGAAG